ncbi:MAG: STN domain-containing protein, partial [Parvibaculum sp.]|nr:STN domain-containing protein [Parvibaculum sp.]
MLKYAWMFGWMIMLTWNVGIGLAQEGATPLATAPLDFNIPAQPLGSALNAFAVASGWQVSASSELTIGIEAPGLIGNHTPEQGLRTLLSGTGLTYRMDGAQMATIERGVLPPVAPVLVPPKSQGPPANGAVPTADKVQKPVKVPEI